MIKILPDEKSLAHAAATVFVRQFQNAMTRSEVFSVVLSGGRTPLAAYALLAEEPFRSQVNWSLINVFWGDERCVKAEDARSNYGEAYHTFLSKVPIPRERIHPMYDSRGSKQCAQDYEILLRNHFRHFSVVFDLVFLGLGTDGHTASLFPNSQRADDASRWVTHLRHAGDDFDRLTLMPEVLNQTHLAVFLVAGQEKADVLQEVLVGSKSSEEIPAKRVQPPQGQILWLVDTPAASRLSEPTSE